MPERTDFGVRIELFEMSKHVFPMIGIGAVRSVDEHCMPWQREAPKVLGDPVKPKLFPDVSGNVRRLSTRDDPARVRVKRGAIRLSTRMKLMRRAVAAKPRRRRDPSEEELNALCMTRREFLECEERLHVQGLREQAEREARREEEDAREAKLLERMERRARRLEEATVKRMQKAAERALKREREEKYEPPWVLVEKQVLKEREDLTETQERKETTAKDLGPAKVPPSKQHKVVPKKSQLEKYAQRHRPMLTKEMVERMEDAAKLARESPKTKPRTDVFWPTDHPRSRGVHERDVVKQPRI